MRYNGWEVMVASEAVAAEIEVLPADMQASYLRLTDLLEEFGPFELGMPYIRPLQDKLWEMRIKGRDGIARGIYVARSGKKLVVLHVFLKKTRKTPKGALDMARKRLKELDR